MGFLTFVFTPKHFSHFEVPEAEQPVCYKVKAQIERIEDIESEAYPVVECGVFFTSNFRTLAIV